ncbi:MAG TPA: FAD-dependent monooxygenase [Candidatus Polarisedimenticolaceae bacterium]|nr:FAD-dependent monooxygenase [Candidatus Polarisedimenticolaceae bacterium]
MSDADVLVVGGGPAGSTLAALAAAKGARVIVLERERFPRDKVCGEFLSAEGCTVLDRLGVLPTIEKAGAAAMSACLLADAAGRSASSPLPQSGIGITRAVMDELLLRTAAARGAAVHEETAVTAPIVDGGRVSGVTTKRGRYRAPIVVAADGRRSVLQRALHPRHGDPLKTTSRSWFGFQAHFPDATSGLGGRIELFVFEGGYAGLGPVEGGRLNLALIATVRALHRSGGKPDRLLRERMMTNPLLAERLRGLSPISGWKTVGPLRFGTRRAASSGALFVGDAAGTVDPFSGEGMSHALLGAEMALPFVLDAAARGGLNDVAARGWERVWHRAFAPATRRTRLIGRLFQHALPASLAMSFLSTALGARALPRLVAASRTR